MLECLGFALKTLHLNVYSLLPKNFSGDLRCAQCLYHGEIQRTNEQA